MAMRLPAVTSAYHRKPPDSSNMPVHQSGQPHMSDPVGLGVNGLIMEEDIDTVVAQTPKATAGDHVAASASTYGANAAPPATTVAHAVTLSANNRAVSHISLSTRRTQAAGK
jgi:hypothetical protein